MPAQRRRQMWRRRRDERPRPDVQVTISGTVLPDGSMQWRTNPLTGKVVYEKPAKARKILADRIAAMDVDVLAVQEVEDVRTLEQFARSKGTKQAGLPLHRAC